MHKKVLAVIGGALFAVFAVGGCLSRNATVSGVVARFPRAAVEFDRDFLTNRFAYPGGRFKALIISFDDGCIQDRKLVALFNRYGIRGTFNLNSGKVVRVVVSNRTYGYVSAAEIPALYAGHEVACHTVNHPYLTRLTPDQIRFEVGQDKKNLEKWLGKPVRGMAFPFNAYNELVVSLLPSLGIEYARSSWGTANFRLPAHPLNWRFTCYMDTMNRFGEKFLALTNGKMALLTVGGHSWDLDSTNTNKNWDAMERFCKTMSAHPEVWNPTMSEYVDYLKAASRVRFYSRGTVAVNPSEIPVWIVARDGSTVKAEPGEKVSLAAGN